MGGVAVGSLGVAPATGFFLPQHVPLRLIAYQHV